MTTQRMTIDPFLASSHELGQIDTLRVDATTEEEITRQKAADSNITKANAVYDSRDMAIS